MSRNPEPVGAIGREIFAPPLRAVAAPDGLPIMVRDHGGDGPALVLIHGWSCHQDFWHRQIEALAPRFRVVTLDLPGHGQSVAKVADRAWSIAAFGADVVAVADALGLETLGLVGHSMGGPVAVEAALRLGPRCRLLLGVDTFEEVAFYCRRPDDEIRARCTVFEADFGPAMRDMVRAITDPAADEAVVDWIGEAMSATPAPLAVAVLEALLAWDIEARWPLLPVPAVAVNSALLAARNELLALPQLDIHPIAASGHFPMLENPDAFNALMLALLARHAA